MMHKTPEGTTGQKNKAPCGFIVFVDKAFVKFTHTKLESRF